MINEFDYENNIDLLRSQVTLASLDNLMFGDYTVPDLLQEDRTYREVTEMSRLDSVIMSYITDFNNTNKTRLNLILFQFVTKNYF